MREVIGPMATGTVPVFVTTTSCAPTPLKVSEEEESVIGPPTKASPVPVRGTVNGEFAALLGIDRVALRTPAADGVNVTGIVQDSPEANGI
jgi:hypothetical protein